MESKYIKIERTLPLIPLRGLAIFPYTILNFDVGRESSLKALDEAMLGDELIFLTSQKEAEIDEPTEEDFYHVGTICKVKQMIKLPGDTVRVLVEGISRGTIEEINQDKGYFEAVIDEIVYNEDEIVNDMEVEALIRNVLESFEEYINIGNRVSPEILVSLEEIENPDRFVDTIASNIYLKPEQKQQILEEFDIAKRLELLYSILLEIKFLDKNSSYTFNSLNLLDKTYSIGDIYIERVANGDELELYYNIGFTESMDKYYVQLINESGNIIDSLKLKNADYIDKVYYFVNGKRVKEVKNLKPKDKLKILILFKDDLKKYNMFYFSPNIEYKTKYGNKSDVIPFTTYGEVKQDEILDVYKKLENNQ